MENRKKLTQLMSDLDEETVQTQVQAMLDEGCNPREIIEELNAGISLAERKFENGEYFIGDLIVSSMLYKDAIKILEPYLDSQKNPKGRIIIGVVAGDIHDIGKDIMSSILKADGFEVIDLGSNVKAKRFTWAVRTYRPDVLLMSGVLSIAQESMKETVDLLQREGLKDEVAVFIGGMCISEYSSDPIGVDGWGYDTAVTLQFCNKIIEEKHERKQ